MTIYEEIKKNLCDYPSARERKNKNKFLAWILKKKFNHKFQEELNKETLEQMIVAINSYDRAWRQVLQMEEHLRGSDYNDKKILEQEKQLDLGYESGYTENIKKLKTL